MSFFRNPGAPEAPSPAGTDVSRTLQDLRVAIVHYWFVNWRGGERVVEALAQMFPQADLFTLFYDEKSLAGSIRLHRLTASFLQRIPGITRHYPMWLPLYPLAIEQFRLDDYDLVISHESGPAKGVLTRSGTCHLCYCHTPPRYLWEMFHDYRSRVPGGALGRLVYSLAAHYLRQWDYAASARVDYFVASSRNCAARIKKAYRRDAEVIQAPVDLAAFSPSPQHEDFYLVVSPLVAYKRIDLAVAACNALKRRLVVIGSGVEERALKKMAGPTVTFLGYQADEVLRDYYRRCRALLFPGEEDFGLTPIEAQASGRPVIAFGRGGALETVAGFFPEDTFGPELTTGVFFAEQSLGSLVEAIQIFELAEPRFSPQAICAHARRFDVGRFREEFSTLVVEKLKEFRARPRRRKAPAVV